MEVLNEIYFGKVISLQQIEDVINKLKSKYGIDGRKNPRLIYKEINRDPFVAKIGEYIRNEFGFGEVIVTIAADSKMRASTMSFLADKHGIAYMDELKGVNIKNTLVVTSNGIRYDNSKFKPNILIVISTGILFSPYVTTEELIAVLLHEIGHSFSKATLGSDEFNARIDEKFADQFVTMYGYGAELTKVLTKVSTNHQYQDFSSLKDIPILNVFIGFNNIRKSLMSRAIDGNEHPTMYKRMKNTVQQLEYELKRSENLTPKQRKELENNIDVAKESIAKYYSNTPNLSDKVYKFYEKNIEHKLGKEIDADKHADLYGSSDLVDQELRSRI